MKKTINITLALMLALALALSLAACGEKTDNTGVTDGGSGDTTNPPASAPSENPADNTPSETTTPCGNGGDSEASGAIAVKYVESGYSGGLGKAFVVIGFALGSDNGKLKGIEDVSAEEAGFSTTSDFTLLTVSVMDSDNSITIYFNGTEENFGDFDNITYTKPTDPVLKDIDGMPVESFNSPQPYHNFDLYE